MDDGCLLHNQNNNYLSSCDPRCTQNVLYDTIAAQCTSLLRQMMRQLALLGVAIALTGSPQSSTTCVHENEDEK